MELYQSGQQPASIPFWLNAVTYYDQVLARDPGNNIALGNKAFALYYAGSSDAPAALSAFIEGASGNPQLAAQVSNARDMLAGLQAAPSNPETTTP